MSVHPDNRAWGRQWRASPVSDVARPVRCAYPRAWLAPIFVLFCVAIGPSFGRAETEVPERLLPASTGSSYLALAPLGGAVHLGGDWDAGFGAALSLVRLQETGGLVGTEVGGIRLANGEHGLLWADLSLGSRAFGGLLMGIGAGVNAEISPIFTMSWGGHATFWAFLGITPYGRIGVTQIGGTYVEFGIKVPLPALRF